MELRLTKPNLEGSKSLEECIYERESIRNFKDKEIENEKISQLLWAAQGKKGSKRTVPSAGATYPLEIYVVLKGQGLYRYELKDHSLELIKQGEFSKKLAVAALHQDFIYEAPLNLCICADYSRTIWRYGNRGIKYIYMEVGHCAQNIHLEAVALGLGSVPIGAFNDGEVKKVLELPKKIDPLYIIPIGYPK